MPVASCEPPNVHTPRVVRTTRLVAAAVAAAGAEAEAAVSEWEGGSRAAQAMPLEAEETDGKGVIRMLLLPKSQVEAKAEPSAQTM